MTPAGTAQGLWLSLRIPAEAKSGNYSGSVTLAFGGATQASVQVPVALVVWAITLPDLNSSSIGTAWSGTWTPEYFAPYYGSGAASTWDKTAWFDLFADRRMPADSIYIGTPRNISDYEALAASGARWFSLLDVCNVAMDGDAHEDTEAGAGLPHRAHRGGLTGSCQNYSDAYVEKMLGLLAPTVEALDKLGLLDRAYVC